MKNNFQDEIKISDFEHVTKTIQGIIKEINLKDVFFGFNFHDQPENYKEYCFPYPVTFS